MTHLAEGAGGATSGGIMEAKTIGRTAAVAAGAFTAGAAATGPGLGLSIHSARDDGISQGALLGIAGFGLGGLALTALALKVGFRPAVRTTILNAHPSPLGGPVPADLPLGALTTTVSKGAPMAAPFGAGSAAGVAGAILLT